MQAAWRRKKMYLASLLFLSVSEARAPGAMESIKEQGAIVGSAFSKRK